MHNFIEEKLSEAKRVINGVTMYDGKIIQELNKIGVKFQFTNEGIRYTF